MHARSVTFVNRVLLVAAAFGLALLPGGCVGVPQTFYAADPVAPEHRAPSRVSQKPAFAPAASTLSDSEKRRLFRDFQQSQDVKDEAATTQAPAP